MLTTILILNTNQTGCSQTGMSNNTKTSVKHGLQKWCEQRNMVVLLEQLSLCIFLGSNCSARTQWSKVMLYFLAQGRDETVRPKNQHHSAINHAGLTCHYTQPSRVGLTLRDPTLRIANCKHHELRQTTWSHHILSLYMASPQGSCSKASEFDKCSVPKLCWFNLGCWRGMAMHHPCNNHDIYNWMLVNGRYWSLNSPCNNPNQQLAL